MFYYCKTINGSENKIKEEDIVTKSYTPTMLNRCLLITQPDKQLEKTVAKLFKLHFLGGFHSSNHAILKNW